VEPAVLGPAACVRIFLGEKAAYVKKQLWPLPAAGESPRKRRHQRGNEHAAMQQVEVRLAHQPPYAKRTRENVPGRRRSARPFVIRKAMPRDAVRRKALTHLVDLLARPFRLQVRLERQQRHLVPARHKLTQIRQNLRLHQRLPHPEITNVKRSRRHTSSQSVWTRCGQRNRRDSKRVTLPQTSSLSNNSRSFRSPQQACSCKDI